MKKIQHKNKRIEIYMIEYKLPLKPSHKDGKHQSHPPPSSQSSKARSIKGFGENISQLSLCINVSHLDISLFNLVSQEMVSPLMVSHSFVYDWVFGYKDGTGVVAHEGNSLENHSKVSHGMHNP
jgi:hypothetical protein